MWFFLSKQLYLTYWIFCAPPDQRSDKTKSEAGVLDRFLAL